MNSPDFFDKQQDFVGTTGLVYFGEDQVLSYTRDGNTTSYPYHVDFAGGGREPGESPYETFERELDEEFRLRVTSSQIVYALRVDALKYPSKKGWFVVAKLEESAISEVVFGDEGLSHQVTSLEELIENPMLIPRRREQIQGYISHMALLPSSLSR